MLYLISTNKGGKNFNGIAGDEIHWKALFKTSEDSLTSSVFSLLFYLPVSLCWSIIREACYSDELPEHCGKLLGYEFWPRWENERQTYTEPDILLQFEDFDLIVEAKRYEFDQQYFYQWQAEANAYYRAADHQKKLYLLAVGGISQGDERATTFAVPVVRIETIVVKTRWHRILGQVIHHQKQVTRAASEHQPSGPILNILKDLILAFRIHGFITADLLNTLPVHLGSQTKQLQKFQPTRYPFHWKPFPQDLLSINIISL